MIDRERYWYAVVGFRPPKVGEIYLVDPEKRLVAPYPKTAADFVPTGPRHILKPVRKLRPPGRTVGDRYSNWVFDRLLRKNGGSLERTAAEYNALYRLHKMLDCFAPTKRRLT